MSFSNFNLQKDFITSIEEAGYKSPTPLQSELIPLVEKNQSALVWTQSASGKTGAFLIPAMNYILENPDSEKRGARILILTSRRDRVSQINYTIKRLSKNHTIRFGFVVSGRPYQTQMRLMRRPLDIMIATPGRLSDLMNNGKADFSQLEMLIVDDLTSIYQKNLHGLVEKILQQAGPDCSTITFVRDDAEVSPYAEKLFSNAIQVNFDGEIDENVAENENESRKPQSSNHKNSNTHNKEPAQKQAQVQKVEAIDPSTLMPQKVHVADDYTHKIAIMDHLMDEFAGEQTVIYSSTHKAAKMLLENLSNHGHAAEMLQDLSTDEINSSDILIYTDQDKATLTPEVMAKKELHIIHFDLPRRTDQYLKRLNNHQLDTKEETLLMVDGYNYNELKHIEKILGTTLSQITVPGLEPLNPFVNLSKNRPANKSSNSQGRQQRKPRTNNGKNNPRNAKSKNTSNRNNNGGANKNRGRSANSTSANNDTNGKRQRKGPFGRTNNNPGRSNNQRNKTVGISRRGTQAPNSDRAWQSDFAEPKERKAESKSVVIRYKKKSLLTEKPDSDS